MRRSTSTGWSSSFSISASAVGGADTSIVPEAVGIAVSADAATPTAWVPGDAIARCETHRAIARGSVSPGESGDDAADDQVDHGREAPVFTSTPCLTVSIRNSSERGGQPPPDIEDEVDQRVGGGLGVEQHQDDAEDDDHHDHRGDRHDDPTHRRSLLYPRPAMRPPSQRTPDVATPSDETASHETAF